MPRSGLDAIWRVCNGPGRAAAAVLQRSESYRGANRAISSNRFLCDKTRELDLAEFAGVIERGDIIVEAGTDANVSRFTHSGRDGVSQITYGGASSLEQPRLGSRRRVATTTAIDRKQARRRPTTHS